MARSSASTPTESRNSTTCCFGEGSHSSNAFDLLWDEHAWSDDQERRRFRNGDDTRYLPHWDRKLRLRVVAPKQGERLLYCDHVEADGEGLFQLACEHDLEGIVAKQKHAAYLSDRETTWFKIRNRSYSQWVGREELFERERGGDPDIHNPDMHGWNSCVSACAAAIVSGQTNIP